MCGFLIISNNNRNISKDEFLKLVEFNDHRGPDETKIIIKNNFLIGFNRLSINDLNNGSQPFHSKKDNLLVCFNGEIFNYKELIKEISNNKITVKSEVQAIYVLYKYYNQEFVKYLKGFFSICILNYKTKKILVANDRFSIKPLYYGKLKTGELFITSDYSPLLKYQFISENLNYPAIQKYLTYGFIEKKTFFRDIYKLQPAEYGYVDNKTKLKKFWRPLLKKKQKNFKDFDFLLKDVINKWKASEVGISLSLSDGVDSILLDKYFEKLKINIEKFTLKPNYKTIDFKKLKMNSKMIKFNTKKAINYLNNYFKISSIPLGNASDLSFFFIYDKISRNKNIKVNFVGEGADEIFGGYDRYKLFLSNKVKYLNTMKKNEIYIKSIFKHYNNPKSDYFKTFKSIKKIIAFDQMHWIPNIVMRHDLIGMMFSIESRPIFLDNEIVKFANNLSIKHKISKTQTKIFLKEFCKLNNIKHLEKKRGTPNYFVELSKDKIFQNSFNRLLKNLSISKKNFNIDFYLKNYSPDNYVLNWRMYNVMKILN